MFSIAWNTQSELGREEKGEGGDTGDLVEKKESQKGERALGQWSRFQVKVGTEDWVPKGTKFDNKYQKAKVKNLE